MEKHLIQKLFLQASGGIPATDAVLSLQVEYREVVCQPLVWPDFVEKLVTTDCHSVVVSYEV
jgi:hypothetical protein